MNTIFETKNVEVEFSNDAVSRRCPAIRSGTAFILPDRIYRFCSNSRLKPSGKGAGKPLARASSAAR